MQNVMQKELMPGLLACAVTSCCRFSPVLMSNPTSPLQPLIVAAVMRAGGRAGGEASLRCGCCAQPPTPKPLTSLHMAGAHPTLFPSRSTDIHGDPRRSSTDITTETHGNHEACACVAYALRLAHTPPERIRHAQATLRRGGSPRHQGGCRCLG